MSSVADALRLGDGTWRWLESEASWIGSTAIAIGSYLLLAFDRLGWPDFAPRATTKFLLTGLYGWLGLTVLAFVIVRVGFARSPSIQRLVRLIGHAHLPLLLLGVVIQIVPVSFGVTHVALWPALFVGVFWMPAMLVSAVRAWADMDVFRAGVAAIVPYMVWAAVIGRYLWDQLSHLL